MAILVNLRHFRYEPYVSELHDLPSVAEDLTAWSYLFWQSFWNILSNVSGNKNQDSIVIIFQ